MSLVSQCGDEQVSGEYNKHYVTLKQIGKQEIIYIKYKFLSDLFNTTNIN